ncbi:MAG: LytTR family transcriptional regulator [Calditrichaeota bacterium]|nr:MAG: LytTR family transcriptional regulator [Calditrichota bacterium]
MYSASGREVVTVNVDDLLVVSSADNYVVVVSRGEKGVRKDLLRTSLNRVEKLLRNYPMMFRCHRTAIVNLRNVKSASGNSQGYRLRLEQLEFLVPVARSRVRLFRKRCAATGCLQPSVR